MEYLDNLNIGEMLEKLNQFADDENVVFSNGLYFGGDFDSYRGYYRDMYLEYDHEDKGFNTVGNLKNILQKALYEGVMTGYKGGEFEINSKTLLWFASYGEASGIMIADVQKIDGQITIIVAEEQW